MKTVSIKEYALLTLRGMTPRELFNGFVLLCLFLLAIQLLELGLKGVLLVGLLFSVYKVLAATVVQLRKCCNEGGSEYLEALVK